MASTRENYNRKGREYHQKRLAKKAAFWNDCIDFPAIRSLAQSVVGGKQVLDLGCGSGLLTRKLAGWGARVTGVDFSSTLIEIARQENPKLSFAVADATDLPYPSAAFSVVVSALVAHYFQDLRPFFGEAHRVLKKKGVFVFSMHHPVMETIHFSNRQKHSGKFLWRPYFHGKKYRWKMLDGMVLESYHHTFEAIFSALHDCGFVVERLIEPKPAKSTRSLQPQAHRLASACPYFCAIRARKI